MKKNVVLAGGTGFIGQTFSKLLQSKGYSVVILTRGEDRLESGIDYVHWDAKNLGPWTNYVNGSYALFNFTGKSINCVYNDKNKQELKNSRLNSVNVLIDCVSNCDKPPKAFIQSGAIGIFGDTSIPCGENAPFGNGFIAELCKEWEESFYLCDLPKTRQVMFRMGIVLAENGGALEPFKRLTRLHLGGTVGSGEQYISWIHIHDLMNLFIQAIENDKYTGIYNATAPEPVPNKVFMKTLRSVMHKGWAPPAPSILVRLGAYFIMRTDPSIALEGTHALPQRLLEEEFNFKYNKLKPALSNLI